jgi:hypothetical protein
MLTTTADLATYLEQGRLEGEWLSAFGLPMRAAVAHGPVSVDLLSKGELARYRSISGIERRRAWLTGKAAHKRLLRRSGRDEDTECIGIPPHGISLSQRDEFAIAVGLASTGANDEKDGRDPEDLEGGEGPAGMEGILDAPETGAVASRPSLRGVGVAVEGAHPITSEWGQAVFSPAEWGLLSGMDAGPMDDERRERAFLRAWTVKSAVFRADPGNLGRRLLDYKLGNPLARKGWAGLAGGSQVTGKFQYLVHYLGGWHISVAVLR